jgi:hypothetical protein
MSARQTQHPDAPAPKSAAPPSPARDESRGRQEQARSCLLPPAEHDRWDAFALSAGCGTIFHTAWWHRAWGIEPVIRTVEDGQGRIEAGICYCVGRRFGVRAIVRPPLTGLNGPLFSPLDGSVRHRQNTHRKKMLLSVIQSLPRLGAYDFMLRPGDADVMPFSWNGFATMMYYTYVLPCGERGTWLNHASKTQRWSVRRAAREAAEKGFTVEEGPPLDDVGHLLNETAEYKNYSTGRYRGRLAAWWRAVQERGAGTAYLLRDGGGQAASVALMVYDGHCAYYVAGGIRRDLRQGSLVNVLLMHRMIEAAHARGLDFDFEGSTLPGVERFFRSFGGELRPLHRVLKFPSLLAYLTWHAYHYWTGHRRRRWVLYD